MIEIELHSLGPYKRTRVFRARRPSPQEVCRVAKALGSIQGDQLELLLDPSSRPDIGGGLLVLTRRHRRHRFDPREVVGIVAWREIEEEDGNAEG